MPKLENWNLVLRSNNPFQAPETCPVALHGRVTGREGFEDGSDVTTSPLDHIEEVGNGVDVAVTKSGTRYTLGAVDPKYVRSLLDRGSNLYKAIAPYRLVSEKLKKDRLAMRPTDEEPELAQELAYGVVDVLCADIRSVLKAEGMDPDSVEFAQEMVRRFKKAVRLDERLLKAI